MKYILGLIVIAALGAGVFFYTAKRDTALLPYSADTEVPSVSETPQTPPEPAPIVIYTETGFEPTTVTIKKGQSVSFKNKSGRAMWVASALHPSHAVYPEKTANDCLGSAFDACRDIADGEDWSFTFNSVGSWGYHDHLRATKFGKVIVTE